MNRFTYGADHISTKALQNVSGMENAKQWLISQLSPYSLPANDFSSAKAISGFQQYRQQKRLAEQNDASQNMQNKVTQPSNPQTNMRNQKNLRRKLINAAKDMAQQTALAHFESKQPIQARLLDFFSNHFSVSRTNTQMSLLAPTLEYEAIAPNLHKSFADMLIAVTRHPAMLLYLNNERSIGPNSKQGLRRKKRNPDKSPGLNENLGREILELHTLGVDAPYTQQDVVELSKALTGWSIGNVRKNEPASFIYRPAGHEPGERQLLGKVYQQYKRDTEGKQASVMLKDLALHPKTTYHLSYKLAKHFIADKPPKALVLAITKRWQETNGHIPSVITALIENDLSWQADAKKFKTPREFVVSACRACGIKTPSPNLYQTLEVLGQGFFNAGSPAGYADHQSAWLGTGAINSRIEWANHFSSVVAKKIKLKAPQDIAQFALGPLLDKDTLQAILRADSKQQAFTLLFMSPDFQRR